MFVCLFVVWVWDCLKAILRSVSVSRLADWWPWSRREGGPLEAVPQKDHLTDVTHWWPIDDPLVTHRWPHQDQLMGSEWAALFILILLLLLFSDFPGIGCRLPEFPLLAVLLVLLPLMRVAVSSSDARQWARERRLGAWGGGPHDRRRERVAGVLQLKVTRVLM